MRGRNYFDDQSVKRIEQSVHVTENMIGNRARRPDSSKVPPKRGGRRLGKTSQLHPKGETLPVDLYEPAGDGSLPGEEVPTGEQEDAYNRMCDLDADVWVYIEEWFDHHEVYAAECPVCG